jgi:endonuclease-3
VVSLLSRLHGLPTKGENTMPVLDSLVRTILSQNTTDKTSRLAFLSLKEAFPTWRAVHDAHGSGAVEAAIKQGGLAEMKARNIHNILAYLLHAHLDKCPRDEPSYEWLRTESTVFIKNELSKHQGVGPKTISCVLMFNLHREEFPVDTHVWHIAKQLKWVPAAANAEQSYAHLNARLPGAAKYPLHVLLVEHGKRCPRCSKNGRLQLPQEGECPLTNLGDKLLLTSPGASATASSSTPSKSTARVKAEAAHGTFDERRKGLGLHRAEEQGCGEHVWVAVKAEPESPAPQVKRRRVDSAAKGEPPAPPVAAGKAGTGKKVLQHLDMQG